MKNILILSDFFSGYGAEHILKWLGNTLSANSFKVTFCSIFDTERNKDLKETAQYYQMCFPRDKYDRYYFIGGVKFLRQLCKKKNYDYVVTFHTNPFLMALMSRPFTGFKILHSERDNPYARDTFVSKAKMWLYRYADKVVFQTEGAQQFFDKKTIRKSTIIPNPIVIPELRWSGFDTKTIVSVGRLHIIFKRQDVLLKAFRKVLDIYPDYKLVLYGDGPDRETLEQQAKDLFMDENVVFKGKVPNVTEKLANEGVFVLSSDSEGMPNALMEAMALGMPVISTDCEPGGAKALIDNGVNGLLVERSSVEKLTAALLILIGDRIMQKKLGNNAREKMKLFAPDMVFNKWLSCFN